jgi:hypothetical protein
MSDEKRPVSQLVKNLTAMIRDYKPTANVGVDVHCLTVIRDALQASEEALQRVLAVCANPPWCADAGGRKNLEAVKAALEIEGPKP